MCNKLGARKRRLLGLDVKRPSVPIDEVEGYSPPPELYHGLGVTPHVKVTHRIQGERDGTISVTETREVVGC